MNIREELLPVEIHLEADKDEHIAQMKSRMFDALSCAIHAYEVSGDELVNYINGFEILLEAEAEALDNAIK